MFAPKVAKPQTKPAARSTHMVVRQQSTLAVRSFDGDAVGRGAILQGTIEHRGGPRYLTRRVSNLAGEAGGEHRLASGESAQTEPALLAQSAAPRDVRNVITQSGHPLDTATLGRFHTSFGHDFSSVRVHTDDRAAASAASRSARAYTVGRHVVFGRGEYAPATTPGRHLLAHELAHVVQQSRGGSAVSGAQHPSLEAAADYAADQASRGAPVVVAGSSPVGIACKTIFEEFTAGKYMWSLLQAALEHDRPVASILDDIKALTAAERDQAITDTVLYRGERGRKLASQTGQQSIQTDPKLQAVFDPVLAEGKRVLDRIDAVIAGLAPAGIVGKTIPGWNFTPEDFARLQGAKKTLTMAADSSWFPAKLQDNLLKTLALVLGSTMTPPATEGINALDFFHGHLVIKKGPATDTQAKSAVADSDKFSKDLTKARIAAIGDVSFSKGYHMTDKKIADYTKVIEKAEPALGTLMQNALTIPGAAVMYHTMEFSEPLDLSAKGQKRRHDEPRRHYVTPLDTNTPQQYTPPSPKSYEAEYTHVAKFAFLVDDKGAVHVRPFDTSTLFTTLELSTITGTTFPEPF